MGSGGSKAHEAFTVAPAATAVADPPADAVGALSDHLADQLAQLLTLADAEPDGGHYEQLSSLTGLLLHEADALPVPAAEQLVGQVKAATAGWLGSLDEEELQQLAADHGFDHPTLVGLHPHGPHPLVHWLDPAYPADLASKTKIQAKATVRYQQLAGGATINGLALTDVEAAETKLGIPAGNLTVGTWAASPAEITGLMADLTGQATGLPSPYSSEYPAAAAALLETERTLHTAGCAELGESLPKLQASAAALVGSHLAATRPLAAHLIDAGVIPDDARWLSASQAVSVARAATASSESADLTQLAADRAATVSKLAAHAADGWGEPHQLLPDSPSGLAGWVSGAGQAAELKQQIAEWAADAVDVTAATGLAGSKWSQLQQQKALSTKFRAWAKGHKLADLRAAAAELGLEHAAKATRAQAQNFLAAHWDASLDATDIQTKVTAKVTAKAAPQTSAAKPTAPASTATTATPPTSVASRAEAYLGTLGTLKAKLRAHQQLVADLPAAVPAAAVATHDWGKGTPFSKGSHTSTVHAGPDGNQWMFKPDKAKGARAHAEAAASAVYRRVGIPGVAVHVATIGSRAGSIQPLVAGATPLTGGPSSWSQADVDAVVQLHVAAWAVGDQDAHDGNVMRSPSGAMFAVDQGQAFKFYGADKLTDSWRPASNHGTPVYQRAYKAHSDGQLARGVRVRAKAALPVLKAFEAIPDDHYREMLHATAVEGVKRRVTWVAPMRKAAAKRAGTGTATVSDDQVVEEFLTHAVQRKNRLRADFAALFGQLGVDDADHLTWVK